MTQDYDYLFKILLVGDSGVGKSALLNRFVLHQFQDDYISTIGIDFHIKTICLDNGVRVKLQLWDTAGQVRFRSLIPSYYKNCDAIIVCYSIADTRSFDSVLSMWLPELINVSQTHETQKLVNVHHRHSMPLVYVASTKHDVHLYPATNRYQESNNFKLFNEHMKLVHDRFFGASIQGFPSSSKLPHLVQHQKDMISEMFDHIVSDIIQRRLSCIDLKTHADVNVHSSVDLNIDSNSSATDEDRYIPWYRKIFCCC